MAKKFDFKKMGIRVGGITAGVAAGKMVSKVLPNMNPLIVNGGKVVLGALAPAFVPKSELVQSIGDGLLANGVDKLLTQFVPGIGGDEDEAIAGDYVYDAEQVNGDDYDPYVNGDSDDQALGSVGNADEDED